MLSHIMATKDVAFIDTLLTNLHSMQKTTQFTDFTMWVKDASLPAHKNIIAAACHYFSALFSSELSEPQCHQAHLDNIEFDLVQNVVHYFYSGNIQISSESVKKLVEAANICK